MNTLLIEHMLPHEQSIQLVQGDITTESVDAIINAANEHLQHGGGVAWAISKKGGSDIQKESSDWVRNHGRVSHANPAWTSAGLLPARYVIHAVGPVWGDGDEDQKLETAVMAAMRTVDSLHLTSIAMPAISTGIFGFPKERAANIILAAIEKHFEEQPLSTLRTVKIVLLEPKTVDIFLKVWQARWET